LHSCVHVSYFLFLFALLFSMLTRSQILRALRAAARQLGRAPTRTEFLHLTGIHYGRLISHFSVRYRSALLSDFAHPKSHIVLPAQSKAIFCCGRNLPSTCFFCLDSLGEQMVD
jgi:hypothetical protein